jgi:carbon monoxide dehydrogenase subunit G
MNLKWQGQEVVPAPKAAVWAFINDPDKVAQCVPDLIESKTNDAHNFDAVVQVAVGPVRGKFKFKIALDPDAGGDRMNLKISGGGFGSVVDLLAGADLKDNGDATTTLDWDGTAQMRGPVATVGGRVIDSQAQRVIRSTFANVKAKCSSSTA